MLPPVRQLFPIPLDDINPAACYAGDARLGSPWVLVNMISTVDGATAVAGRSGALGGPADKRVFAAIRSVADFILVGAGTVRAENYGPPETGARLVIVSGSLDLDPAARVFSGEQRPLVVTTRDAKEARGDELTRVADIATFGQDRLAIRGIFDLLSGVVVCEGGPSLNGQLIAEDLVDEMCLTFAALLVSGASARVAHGAELDEPRSLRLDRILEEDGLLFLRYVRSR